MLSQFLIKSAGFFLAFFVFLVGIFSGTAPADPASAWQTVQEQEGIRVDRRQVPDSPLHEFRAYGIIDVPISRILAVFADSARTPEWMSGVVEQKILGGTLPIDLSAQACDTESTHRCGMDLYNRIKIGTGFTDRDVVVWIRLYADVKNKQVWLLFNSVDRYPKTPGVVRMPFLNGHWMFRPIQGGEATFAEYQVHGSPGMWFPNWVVNLASKKVPYETLSALKKQAHLREYPAFEKMISTSEGYQSLLQP